MTTAHCRPRTSDRTEVSSSPTTFCQTAEPSWSLRLQPLSPSMKATINPAKGPAAGNPPSSARMPITRR